MMGKKNGSGFLVYFDGCVISANFFWKILIAFQLSGSELIAY